MEYIIHKDGKKKKITSVIKMDYPYVMKPKIKHRDGMLEIKEIAIINPFIKEKICLAQFNRIFKRLTKITLEIMDGSNNEGDGIIALNEILHTKEIILDQYLHSISKQEIKKMLKKLEYLEEQLKNYFISLNMKMNFDNYLNEEKTKGR